MMVTDVSGGGVWAEGESTKPPVSMVRGEHKGKEKKLPLSKGKAGSLAWSMERGRIREGNPQGIRRQCFFKRGDIERGSIERVERCGKVGQCRTNLRPSF
jgi:hypothetical protein